MWGWVGVEGACGCMKPYAGAGACGFGGDSGKFHKNV